MFQTGTGILPILLLRMEFPFTDIEITFSLNYITTIIM
jgi:hypothetical protein